MRHTYGRRQCERSGESATISTATRFAHLFRVLPNLPEHIQLTLDALLWPNLAKDA